MIKLKELLRGPVDTLLFHATFNDLVPYIQRDGLVPNGKLFKNFEDIEWGVYMSNNDNFAGSMAQATENTKIPEKWLGEIVILVIDTRKLDMAKMDMDPHVAPQEDEYDDSVSADDSVKSYIYKGVVPPSAIVEIYDYTG